MALINLLCTCLVLALLSWIVLPTIALAQEQPSGEEAFSGLFLDAGVFSSHPAALEVGMVVGGTLRATWQTEGPLFFNTRFKAGQLTESNLTWRIEHTELRLGAAGGVALSMGSGSFIAQLEVGGLMLMEERNRHQGPRLGETDVVIQDEATDVQPYSEALVGVRIFVVDLWAVQIGAGPAVNMLVTDEGERSLELGWSGEATLGRGF